MSLSDFPQEIVEAHDYGHVGAGVVVPFAPRREKRTVVIPKGLARASEVGTMTISGESLTGDGIHDGDVLVFRMNHTTRQITPESVCVVRIEPTGELAAKHIIRNIDGPRRIALRSSHPDYPDRVYDEPDVEILGLAIAVQKMSDKFGRFSVKSEPRRSINRSKLVAVMKQFEKPEEELPF
jgi:SOS-response transcriptional repressor LexA